jgi:uncharacterized membrane protein YfcA
LGHVDKKLGIFMLITALIGIRLAVWISTSLFGISDTEGDKGAAANLYISAIFVVFLSGVSISMLIDVVKSRAKSETGPSKRIADFLSRLRLFPMIHFPVADVTVSLWVLLAVGLFTGYLAGTIGVGGFIGVPAMIYVFGVPTAVAAGTELFLAMFMGAFGAINYALAGFVDIRLVVLLYMGSLMGIFIGTYGTKVVNEVVIRLVTAIVILLCVVSRAIAVPIYLAQLRFIDFVSPASFETINAVSKYSLYAAGFGGCGFILFHVFRAYLKRRRFLEAMALSSN